MSIKGIGIQDFGSLAVAFAVVAITISLGASILGNIQSTQTTNTVAYNVSGYGLTGVGTMGNWLGIIAIVLSAVIVIGVVRILG